MSHAPSPASERVEAPPAEDRAAPADVSRQSALVFFVLGEVVALAIYVAVTRSMWFRLDEWDFLSTRTGGDLGDLFRAHNEHWVTLPVLAYRLLWWLFGLRTYLPYQLVIIVAHLVAAFLVRAVMRRCGVRPWTATVAASVLVFFGSGYQNVILPFQMTLVGSLVFGLAQLLLATHDGGVDRRDAWALAAGCAAIMCSGVGVSMVVAAGVAVVVLRGLRVALLHTVPLAAVYLVWFATVGHEGFAGHDSNVGDVAGFVRHIVAATFGALGYYRGLGWILGAVLVAGLVVAWRPLGRAELRRQAAIPLALVLGALVFLGITGVGRAGSQHLLENSRYLHLVAAMLLPALAVAVDALAQRWRRVAPLLLVALLVGIPGNVRALVDYTHKPIIERDPDYRQMMLSLPFVPAATQVPRDVVPDQQFAHTVTIGWLLGAAASGRIRRPGVVTAADEAVDTLRLSFRQLRFGQALHGAVCESLATPRAIHLDAGQRVVVAARSGVARITPVGVGVGSTYPFVAITVAGSVFEAVRPVDFEIASQSADPGRICAPPAVLRAPAPAG